MKTIPGSNPPMYIEENGTVKDQFFKTVFNPSKPDPDNLNHDVNQEIDEDGVITKEEQGDAFVMVAGKKRYIAELMLETHKEDARKAASDETFRFIDGDRENFEPDNLEWYKTSKALDDSKSGLIDNVPEAGQVSDTDVDDESKDEPKEGSKEESKEEVDPTEGKSKKEMIGMVVENNPEATISDIETILAEEYGVEVSQGYISNVKKEL